MKEAEVNMEFRYEQYVWITLGWYGEEWWTLSNDSVNCTDQDVEQFLPNTIALFHANTADNESAPTDVLLVRTLYTLYVVMLSAETKNYACKYKCNYYNYRIGCCLFVIQEFVALNTMHV